MPFTNLMTVFFPFLMEKDNSYYIQGGQHRSNFDFYSF